MSASVSLIGGALLAVLLAGYLAQRYLPPPTPSILGVDLGTTFSSVAVYRAVTGESEPLADADGRRIVPSVVTFMEDGRVLVGRDAVDQAEHNPERTFYDAKRFIGKKFSEEEFRKEAARYPFQIVLKDQFAYFVVPPDRLLAPEEVGGHVVKYLRQLAERRLSTKLYRCVLSVPAEFDEAQRNASLRAATSAGLEVLRLINEPTAAALAYGLHKKEGVEHVLIVDLGGGTLDVSLLLIQGGMFITRAMAGNNHLGGQDFNQRMILHLLRVIETRHGVNVTDKEDFQNLRLAVEEVKLNLTEFFSSAISVRLHSLPDVFSYEMTRAEFETLNSDLFMQILRPVRAALDDADLDKSQVDEVVLVGGSTRIPKIRRILADFFGKEPNYGVDPELAVATGVAVQAGVMGGGWPLRVAATELPTKLKKIHIFAEE